MRGCLLFTIKCMTRFIFFIIITTSALQSWAQAPVIQKIEPLITFPYDTIVISGNGFHSDPSQLQVWFDQVKGTIVASSTYAIEVIVPAQAKVSNIEVINLTAKLSAKAPLKFMPSFEGANTFDPAKFIASVNFTAPEELWDLCTCDLNADGKPDIASTKFASTNSPYATSSNIMVLQSTPGSSPGSITTSSFTTVTFPLTFATDHILCGDLQGDGKPELVVSRAGASRNSIHILRNTTNSNSISFASPINLFLDVGHFATRMAIRDLNKDGKPEIIVTNSFNDVFYVFINQSSAGNISFASPLKFSIKIGNADVLTTYDTEVQDFNGDKLPDIIITQFQTNDLYILKNESKGAISFSSPQKIPLAGALNRLASADLNKDGLLDLVTTNTLNNQVFVLLNQSTVSAFSFAAPIILSTSVGAWGVDIGDIDGDYDPDIIIANRNTTTTIDNSELKINVFLHNGNFSSPSFTRNDIATANPTRNIKIGDYDGDGKPDIAYTAFNVNARNTYVGILRNTNCFKPRILNNTSLTICNGQTIRLQGVPPNNVTYDWKKGTTSVGSTAFLDITNADAGTYTIVGTGEGGACVQTSNPVVVTSNATAAPTDPVINANTPLCAGTNLNLSTLSIGGASYAWTGPDGFTSVLQNPTLPVTSKNAGTYMLQVTVGACKSNPITKRIDVSDLSDFFIASTNASKWICEGTNITLSVNDLPNYSFQWKKNGSILSGQTTASTTVSQDGSYGVTVTNTVLNCVIEPPAFDATIMARPVAAFNAAAKACASQEFTFSNQSQVDSRATAVYNWNLGDGGNSTDKNPKHIYNTAKTISVSVAISYTEIPSCTANATKNITVVNPILPEIISTTESSCPDEQFTLSLSSTFASILWDNASTAGSVTLNQPGTYKVTTTDANGCKGTTEKIINAKSLPVLTAGADKEKVAPQTTVQLHATGADTYSWSPAILLDNPLIADPTTLIGETTMFEVTGTSADGCEAKLSVMVEVDPALSGLQFPPAFSPNGDGDNEMWVVQGAENFPDCTLTIFDGHGRRVFEKKGQPYWDGTYQGKPLPEGTYYYVHGCPDKKITTGNILIFK